MDIFAYSSSNQGGRARNEDYCAYFLDEKRAAFVLADGLGGHAGGDVASRLAVETILSQAKSMQKYTPIALHSCIAAANEALVEAQRRDSTLNTMRTTIAAALVHRKALYVASIGDSRIYHFRDGRVIFQSRDDSASQHAVDLGHLAFDGIRFHGQRNILLKSLGNPNGVAFQEPRKRFTLRRGDALLLCSDGFWEYVYEREMLEALADALTPAQWYTAMEARLKKRAVGNHDNYSAICVMAQ